MSYRWIVFGIGLAAVGGGAWYFSRPVLPRVTPAAEKVAEATPIPAAPVAAPREPPPPVIEVFDLARAYEPVREADTSPQAGGVNPASLVRDPSAPMSIPYAAPVGDDYTDLLVVVHEVPTGSFLPGTGVGAKTERIAIQPRVVGVEGPVPQAEPPGRIGYAAVYQDGPTAERLKIMPREVVPVQIQREEREDDFIRLGVGP